jgi:hypothetical protein
MKITIHEPWWGAWSKFNWPKPIWGIGIKKKDILEALQKGERVFIHVDRLNEDYWFSPDKVYAYCKQRKAMYLAGKKTLLYVIPKFMMERVVKDEVPKQIEIPF